MVWQLSYSLQHLLSCMRIQIINTNISMIDVLDTAGVSEIILLQTVQNRTSLGSHKLRRRLLCDAQLQPKVVKTLPVRGGECGLNLESVFADWDVNRGDILTQISFSRDVRKRFGVSMSPRLTSVDTVDRSTQRYSGPRECPYQTPSHCAQWLSQGASVWQTDRKTDRLRYGNICYNRWHDAFGDAV